MTPGLLSLLSAPLLLCAWVLIWVDYTEDGFQLRWQQDALGHQRVGGGQGFPPQSPAPSAQICSCRGRSGDTSRCSHCRVHAVVWILRSPAGPYAKALGSSGHAGRWQGFGRQASWKEVRWRGALRVLGPCSLSWLLTWLQHLFPPSWGREWKPLKLAHTLSSFVHPRPLVTVTES